MIARDGRIIPLEINVRTLKDKDGKPIGKIGAARDITRRKEVEKALKESEASYRTILESIGEGYFELDASGHFAFFNNTLCKILGYPEEILTGMSYREIMPPRSRKKISRAGKALHETESRQEMIDVEIVRKDKTSGILEISLSLIRDPFDAPAGFRGIARDVTDRKSLEAQLLHAQKMEAIGTLAGGIAHDFNNLLMAIQGNTSLMNITIDRDHPHYKRIKHIEQCVQSGSDLTKQLLGFARGGKYEARPIDINLLVEKTSSMFEHMRKEISVRRKYQEGIWCVEADKGRIEQVLLNLCVNAWQAMPDGGDLSIETSNVAIEDRQAHPYEAGSANYVRISVADTGIGMDENTMSRIFEPFFTTKDMSRGSGLGLASAYGIVRNHGGFIKVSSQPGSGSTFSVFLPATDGEASAHEIPESADILTGNETILLIDDESMVLEIGSELLSRLGYRVMAAGSGMEAVRIFRDHKDRIDLVILDMIMPGIGGSETYDRIKQIRSDVKVVLSSGYSLNGHAAQILKRGCNGFIQKPFDLSTFSRKIRESLG